MLLNLSLFLTFLRLILAPFIFPILFYLFLPLNSFFINFLIALLFSLFSLTDFFDGYIARKYNQVTDLGKVLDHVADKVFVSASLISLACLGKISLFVAIVLVSREFFISGLREFSAEKQMFLKVSSFGKTKTTFQFIYIIFSILNINYLSSYFNFLNIIQIILAFIVLYFSLFSAYNYFLIFYKNFLRGSDA